MDKRRQLIILGVLAVALGLFFFHRWRSLQAPGPFLEEAKERGDVLHVQVAGDMVVAGVYEMPPGSTLSQLLEQASFTGETDRLPTLWRDFPLLDGSLFEIRKGEDGAVEIRRGAMSGQMLTLFFTPIDINTASATDLEALPGIGAGTAEAIVRHREEHGPFHAIEELRGVRGVGPKTLEKLRDQIYIGEDDSMPAALDPRYQNP